jgi:hypothetical protein
MTTVTDERKSVAEVAEEQGWQRRVSLERHDIYLRGTVRIRVMWERDDKLNGATLFHDEMYESYTREPNTLRAWFKR